MKDKFTDLQDEVKNSAHKIWLAGLGALTVAGEEGSKLFKTLVEKGEAYEEKGDGPTDKVKETYQKTRERAEDMWSKFENSFNDKVGIAMHKLGVPTRDEINQLTQRVDALMEAISKLNKDEDKKEA
jgi:poly(hydroxyalkanoate) granule-associated protein